MGSDSEEEVAKGLAKKKGGRARPKRKNQSSDSTASNKKKSKTTKATKKKAPAASKKKPPQDSDTESKESKGEDKVQKKKNVRPVNFIEEEDIFLCRALVNVSQDGAKGTDQTMQEYWERIKEKFDELVATDKVCLEKGDRPWKSLQNRFDRHIRRQVNKYNSFYKAAKEKNPSGWNEENFIEEACQNYLVAEGKPFGLSKCAKILWECPKFDPVLCDLTQDPDDDDAKCNRITKVMGEDKERPLGAKASKAGKTKSDAATLASLETDKLAAMRDMTSSTNDIAAAILHQSVINPMMEEARLYREAGMMDEFTATMREVKKLREQGMASLQAMTKKREATSVANTASLPTSIEVTSANNNDNETDKEDQQDHLAAHVARPGVTSKSVVDDALDSGDEDDEDEEESTDSKLVKRHKSHPV